MNQEIMCTVDNCHYWAQGNHCHADQILVTIDSLASTVGDDFDAPKASTASPTPADSCMDTCCKTFVHKGSPDINNDGVYRT